MADTGILIKDAIDNLAASLETKRVTWKLKKIFPRPEQGLGVVGPCLCLQPGRVTGQLIQGSKPTVHVAWKVPIKIWFFDANARFEAAYERAIEISGLIAYHIVENPRPNGYGELLLEDQGFGPQVGEFGVAGEGSTLYGVFIEVVLTYFKDHTQVGT